MANPLQFAFRTQKAIGLFQAAPVYETLPGFDKPEGTQRCCVYSPCGEYFAYASNDGVTIVNASTGELVAALPLATVYELGFSPRGSFLSTWERPAKDEAGDATKNLKIWRVVEEVSEGAAKQPLGQFVQKSQSGWNLQYTADERFCARRVTNEVQFYDSNQLSTVWNKLRVEGVADFAIAPGQDQNVAVFIPEHKGQPAAVKVFNVPQFEKPISQKNFFKGDKVQLKWNAQGSSLIVLAQTDVDKSNKSYYGETNMYLLSANGSFDARVSLDKEGPIHDVEWCPNSKEFGVVYGYMPAKTTVFNVRAVALHSFPIGPRNTIIFSPTGRFVLVAGFGNLAGQIDVYDLERDYAKICTIESGNPSVCTWSPDSRYIMTATTSPRLRVDNGVKIWHAGGTLVYNEDMVELYNVIWRPAPPGSLPSGDPLVAVPTAHSSATAYLGTVKTPSKPAGAYRPPGARGTSTPLHFKREDEGGAAHVVSNGTSLVGPNGFGRQRRHVPGAEALDSAVPADGDENLSKAALKNKKKRNNRKVKDGTDGNTEPASENKVAARPRENGHGQEGQSVDRRVPPSHSESNELQGRSPNRPRQRQAPSGADATQPLPQGNPTVVPAATNGSAAAAEVVTANQKRIRALQKKIRAIEDLEMRLAGGEKLEDTQVQKISSKQKVAEELTSLERDS